VPFQLSLKEAGGLEGEWTAAVPENTSCCFQVHVFPFFLELEF